MLDVHLWSLELVVVFNFRSLNLLLVTNLRSLDLMLDIHISTLMLDIHGSTSLNLYVSLNIHITTMAWDVHINSIASRNVHIDTVASWYVHVDSTLVGNSARITCWLLDSIKFNSAIVLLHINITANVSLIINITATVWLIINVNIVLVITVNINVGSGCLGGDEVPLRSRCFSIADMVRKDWDDTLISILRRLKILRSSSTSSELSFSNISISNNILDICHSEAKVPSAA